MIRGIILYYLNIKPTHGYEIQQFINFSACVIITPMVDVLHRRLIERGGIHLCGKIVRVRLQEVFFHGDRVFFEPNGIGNFHTRVFCGRE